MSMEQVFVSGTNDDPSLFATEYTGVINLTGLWNFNIAISNSLVPAPFTLKEFKIELGQTPGNAPNAYDFTIMKNDIATDITINITGEGTGNKKGKDDVNTVDFVATDTISIRQTPSSVPTQANEVKWSFIAVSANDNDSIWMAGSNNDLDITSTEYNHLYGYGTWVAVQANRKILVSAPGTLKDLYMELQNDPAINGFDFTVFKNDIATSMTVGISAGSTTGNDLSNQLSLVAGDTVSIECNPNLSVFTTGRVIYGVVFEADNADEYVIPCGSDFAMSQSSTEYNGFVGGGNWFTSESLYTGLGQTNAIMTGLEVLLSGVPGASPNEYIFTLRKNAVDTALEVTIGDGQTTGSDTGSVALADFDLLSIQVNPNSTPTSRDSFWGITIDANSPVTAAVVKALFMGVFA